MHACRVFFLSFTLHPSLLGVLPAEYPVLSTGDRDHMRAEKIRALYRAQLDQKQVAGVGGTCIIEQGTRPFIDFTGEKERQGTRDMGFCAKKVWWTEVQESGIWPAADVSDHTQPGQLPTTKSWRSR